MPHPFAAARVTFSLALLASMGGILGFSQAASADTVVPPPLPSISGLFPVETMPVGAMETTLMAKVNAERLAAGLPALANQPWAASIARAHSQDMAASRNMWHNYTGYLTPAHQAIGAYLTGENVAIAGTLDEADYDLVHSPEHLANILYPRFNYVGIGIATDASGYVYVTQDFADILPAGAAAPATAAVAKPAAAPAPAAAATAAAPTLVSHAVPAPKPTPAVPVAVPLVLGASETQPPAAPVTTSAPAVAPADAATAPPTLVAVRTSSQSPASAPAVFALAVIAVGWVLSRCLRSSVARPWNRGSRSGGRGVAG